MQEVGELKDRIAQARQASGLTVAEAARHMAVNAKTFKGWENGQSYPRANKLTTLAGILGVPIVWLIGGDEDFDPVDHRQSRLDRLEQKLQRLQDLQLELQQLGTDIADEIKALRGSEKGQKDIAA